MFYKFFYFLQKIDMTTLDKGQWEAMWNPNGCIFWEVCVWPIRLLLQKTLQEQVKSKNSIIELWRWDFAFFEVNGKKIFVAMDMKKHPHHNGIQDYVKSMNPWLKLENLILWNYNFDGTNITLSQRYSDSFGWDLNSIQDFLEAEELWFSVSIEEIQRDFGDKWRFN